MSFNPGATIGVLGSGQLGRMFAFAAHRLGYRVCVFSPDSGTPAGQAADREITAPYEDKNALRAFARRVDVVTVEFESIPLSAIEAVERIVPVRPGLNVLATAQNRIAEKTTLQQLGLPVPEFAPVSCAADIERFIDQAADSRPVVLKSASAGYDGKGQSIVNGKDDALEALHRIGDPQAIVEAHVDFECELSVVGARSVDGEIQCFGPIHNEHRDHILDVSVAPSDCLLPAVRAEAIEITQMVLEQLEVCGVLCVEFFYTRDGRLLVNEIAPRPHNSGHLTIEAATTSQFEQQVRAVCGLPLGSMQLLRPAAIANLLGEQLMAKEPDWNSLLAWPTLKLHLYGKGIPRAGRKMGHMTATASSSVVAESHVRGARRVLASHEMDRPVDPRAGRLSFSGEGKRHAN